MAHSDFLKHEFVELLAAITREPIKRVHELDPDAKMKGKEFTKQLNNSEEFAVDVFVTAERIVETVEQLRFIPVFLRNFPIRNRLKKFGINHPKYLRFHLEMHFIKIATLLDQMAILINKVYRLGIQEKRCSIDTILENEHTRHSNAAKLLKNFNKSIQGIKSFRNLIVHRGIFDDKELDELGMFYYLTENPIPNEEELFSDTLLKIKTRFTIKNKLVIIKNNNKTVDVFVPNCFESLIKEFKKQYELLSTNSS